MSVVVITGSGFEHRYVANRICEAHKVAAILVCDPPTRRRSLDVLRRSPMRFADKMARRVYLSVIGDASRRRTDLLRTLGPDAVAFAYPDLVERVGRPKEPLLLERVNAIQPDVIAVYGTGVVPDAALDCAKAIALNMHTGLSPDYRGVACAVWPLIDGRPEMLGATVHECTSKVDGGQIFERRRASIEASDSLHSIFARAVLAGTEAYLDVITRALNGTLKGVPQDPTLGREYKGTQIGLRSELAARRALRRLS